MKENIVFLYPYDKEIEYSLYVPYFFYFGYDEFINLSKMYNLYKKHFFTNNFYILRETFITSTLKSILINKPLPS